jgi:hypothetical protein
MRMHALHTPLRFVSTALAGALLLAAASTATAETRTIPGTDVTATDCPGCSEAQMRTIVGTFDYGHHHFYDLSARVLRSFRKNCEQDPWLGRPEGNDRDRKPRPEGEPAPSFFGCNGTVLVFETIPNHVIQQQFDAMSGIWHATGGTMKATFEVPISEFEGAPGSLTDVRQIAGNTNMIAAIESQIERNMVGNQLLAWLESVGQRADRFVQAREDIMFRIVVVAPNGVCAFTTSENAGNQATFESRSCMSAGGNWIPAQGEQQLTAGGSWSAESNGLTLADWASYFAQLQIPVTGSGDRIMSCSRIGDQPVGCVKQ